MSASAARTSQSALTKKRWPRICRAMSGGSSNGNSPRSRRTTTGCAKCATRRRSGRRPDPALRPPRTSGARIGGALRRIVPGEGVIVSEPERRAYESDGLTAYRQKPLVVVLPSTVAQVAAVLRLCRDERIKVVPRGAGTSLSGGALPLADGIL